MNVFCLLIIKTFSKVVDCAKMDPVVLLKRKKEKGKTEEACLFMTSCLSSRFQIIKIGKLWSRPTPISNFNKYPSIIYKTLWMSSFCWRFKHFQDHLVEFNFSIETCLFMTSYISSISQIVKIRQSFSQAFGKTSGIPQGSNFGPLLIVIFINPSIIYQTLGMSSFCWQFKHFQI